MQKIGRRCEAFHPSTRLGAESKADLARTGMRQRERGEECGPGGRADNAVGDKTLVALEFLYGRFGNRPESTVDLWRIQKMKAGEQILRVAYIRP